MQSSIVSYSQSQLNASVPWLVTAQHRESPYMPAWLGPASRQSVATMAATANVSLTGRISRAAVYGGHCAKGKREARRRTAK